MAVPWFKRQSQFGPRRGAKPLAACAPRRTDRFRARPAKNTAYQVAPDLGILSDASQRLATFPSNPAASKDRPLYARHICTIRYAEQGVGRPMPCLRAAHSTIVAAHPMIVCATPDPAL